MCFRGIKFNSIYKPDATDPIYSVSCDLCIDDHWQSVPETDFC